MTHDPVAITPTAESLVALWVRGPGAVHHWTMAALGLLDDVEVAFTDYGIHFPEMERLLLPAQVMPCGPPAPCHQCDRTAEYRGHTHAGELVLLCGSCLTKATR